ncbi:hypothetical protein [Blastococcus sp. URHD0036]|uniref:hypothetical protein n=1 Tax=Blastococcus sp. URHD0036 TaxID=1380356 RepID=UPI0012DE517F|nr:hypothetical protein [Blastococcus sp. URHD0036]
MEPLPATTAASDVTLPTTAGTEPVAELGSGEASRLGDVPHPQVAPCAASAENARTAAIGEIPVSSATSDREAGTAAPGTGATPVGPFLPTPTPTPAPLPAPAPAGPCPPSGGAGVSAGGSQATTSTPLPAVMVTQPAVAAAKAAVRRMERAAERVTDRAGEPDSLPD